MHMCLYKMFYNNIIAQKKLTICFTCDNVSLLLKHAWSKFGNPEHQYVRIATLYNYIM